jgi:hypothetical protein
MIIFRLLASVNKQKMLESPIFLQISAFFQDFSPILARLAKENYLAP